MMTPKLEKHVGNFSCLSRKQGSPLTRPRRLLHSAQIDLEVMLWQEQSSGSESDLEIFLFLYFLFFKIKVRFIA